MGSGGRECLKNDSEGVLRGSELAMQAQSVVATTLWLKPG